MAEIDHLGLGRKITSPQQRDAVHIAIAPVKIHNPGDHWIPPACKVKWKRGSREYVVPINDGDTPIGIIDPFLDTAGYELSHGDEVWLWLFPGTVTSLRHDWEHPAFNSPPPAPINPGLNEEQMRRFAEARLEGKVQGNPLEYMQRFADDIDEDVRDLMFHAENFARGGDYWSKGGKFEGQPVPEDFWDYFWVLTGLRPEAGAHHFFSCSC